MNKILKAATGIAMLMGTSANALPNIDLSKFYGGLTYIENDTEIKKDSSGTPPKSDFKDDGFGAFLGYQFNDIIGLELSYKEFGNSELIYTNPDDTTAKANQEYMHGALSLVLGHNMNENFRLFGKVGYGVIHTEQSGQNNDSRVLGGDRTGKLDESGSEQGENYGVGVQYQMNNFFVRAEYEVLPDNGGLNPNSLTGHGYEANEDSDLYTVSVGLKF